MKSIELLTVPQLLFAHSFSADSYSNSFPGRESVIEVSYIKYGLLDISCGDEKYTAQKGDICCTIHDVPSSVSADSPHCHHTFCVKVEHRICEDYSGLILPPVTRFCEESEAVCDMIDEFLFNKYTYENSTAHTARLTFEILCKIDEINRRSITDTISDFSLIVQKAKRYIHDNIRRPLMQKDIAEKVGVTPEYLCSVFKKSEGTTLIKYVNRLKLDGIRLLMERENLKLYEASVMYGFGDANYVSSLYKKTFGRCITDKADVAKLEHSLKDEKNPLTNDG